MNINEIAELINRAERPFIYFGGGVKLSEASDELREFIQKADIPAAYTLMAAGVLGYGERHNLGLIGMHGNFSANAAANRADVMLAIGTRFSDRVALNTSKFGHNSKIVHIDIDPAEINKNITADYSITIEMRTPTTFPLQEVWMVRKVLTANPLSLHLDTICLPTTTDGRSLSGDGVTMRNHSIDTPSIFLNQHQEGTIQLYHIMSQQVLPQVSSVGVKVEIAN